MRALDVLPQPRGPEKSRRDAPGRFARARSSGPVTCSLTNDVGEPARPVLAVERQRHVITSSQQVQVRK